MRLVILSAGLFVLGCEAHLSLPSALSGASEPAPEPPHERVKPVVAPSVTTERPPPSEEIDRGALNEEALALPLPAPPEWLHRRPNESAAHHKARLRAEEASRQYRKNVADEQARVDAVKARDAEREAKKDQDRVATCRETFPARLAAAQSELRDAAAYRPQQAKMCAWVRSHACELRDAVVTFRRGNASVTQRVSVVCSVMPPPYDEALVIGCLQGAGPGGTNQSRPSGLPDWRTCTELDPVALEAEDPDTPEGKAILSFKPAPSSPPAK